MNAHPLEQDLRDYFDIEVRENEPSTQWWVNAVSHALEQKRRSHRFGFVPRTRLAWVLLPLILLIIAGVAYATSSVVRERFVSLFPHIEQTGLTQELDLRQTIDGVTVRVERAYADSNGVLVGYTVSGPPTTATGPGSQYFSNVGSLVVTDGPTLRPIFASGTVPGSQDVLGDWNPSDRLAVVAAFDASAVQGAPSELSVMMTIKVSDRVPLPGTQATQNTFTFDLKVKFHPGTKVEVGETIEAAGVPITLEQVLISHWAARIVFSFAPPYDERDYTPALVVSMTPAGSSPVDGGGLFYGDFTSQKGEWVVTINELVFFDGLPPGVDIGVPENENGQIRPQGPWVFRFQVP